jgi:hypothetical protein
VDERAEYLPWLRGPQRQLEFVIDGLPLHRRLLAVRAPDDDTSWLGEPFDLTSVADLSWPAQTADDLRRLAGTQPRDDKAWPLAPGRQPLYVCPMCADLGCGAITVHVDHTRPGQVTWSRLLHESGLSTEYDLDPSAVGTFTFDADAYRQVFLEPVGVLEALAADERAAKARHRREHPQRQARRWLDRLSLRGRRRPSSSSPQRADRAPGGDP